MKIMTLEETHAATASGLPLKATKDYWESVGRVVDESGAQKIGELTYYPVFLTASSPSK